MVFSGFNGFQWLHNEKSQAQAKNFETHFLRAIFFPRAFSFSSEGYEKFGSVMGLGDVTLFIYTESVRWPRRSNHSIEHFEYFRDNFTRRGKIFMNHKNIENLIRASIVHSWIVHGKLPYQKLIIIVRKYTILVLLVKVSL